MRSFFTLLLICLFTQFESTAQDFEYGLGIGTSFSTISTIGFDSATNPEGLGVLIYAHGNYSFSDRLSLDGRLGYDNRKVNYDLGGESLVSINYLSLTPMLKLDLGGEIKSGAFFKGGLRFSQLLSVKERESGVDLKDSYKGMNIGTGFSFGLDFLDHYGLELMFDFGITDELENSNSDLKINSAILMFYVKLDSLLGQ